MMPTSQALIIIGVLSLGTAITRFLPFLLFPDASRTPKYILYLGKVLPMAVMGMLVVYCLKDVSVMDGYHGLPEAIAILGIALVHRWKKNMLISVGFGTVFYMVLVQLVFV